MGRWKRLTRVWDLVQIIQTMYSNCSTHRYNSIQIDTDRELDRDMYTESYSDLNMDLEKLQ